MSGSDGSGDAILIEKILRAGPDRVFRAFLEPDLMRRWIAPDDLDIDRITVDARVDGRIEVWHSRNGVSTGRFEGRFVKIDPPRELVYHWAFVGTEPDKGEYFDTLIRVRLAAHPGGRTVVTIVHERLAELRTGASEVHQRIAPGWENCLDKLDRAVREVPADTGGSWETRCPG